MIGINTMTVRRNAARTLALGGLLLAALVTTLPQAAQAQFGEYRNNGQNNRNNQGRYGQGRNNRQQRQDDRYTYGTVRFNYDWNGFTLADRAAVENDIRRALNTDAGSRFVGRRAGSQGSLDVNIAFNRVSRTDVRVSVRLGLNRDGSGSSWVTATQSETVLSRDRTIDTRPVLQAFRGARREFTQRVNDRSRDDR